MTTKLSPYQLYTFSAQVVTTSGADKVAILGLALLTLSWDKNWDSHSLVYGYPSFYPSIALVAPSPEKSRFLGQCIAIYVECWNLYHMIEGDHRDCSAFFLCNQHTTTICFVLIKDLMYLSLERLGTGREVLLSLAVLPTHCRYRALKWIVAMMLTLSSLMVPQVVIKITCDTINNDKVVTMPTSHTIKKIR